MKATLKAGSAPTGRHNNPLSEEIRNEKIVHGLTIPILEQYNPKNDPRSHLTLYETRMEGHGHNENMLAKIFPSTLKPEALTWWSSLEEGSIKSYSQLVELFLKRFERSVKRKRPVSYLGFVVQQKNEDVRDFLIRFSSAVDEVEKHSVAVRVSQLYANTTNWRLRNLLSEEKITTEHRLEEICEKIVYAEHFQKNLLIRKHEDKGKGKGKAPVDQAEPMDVDPTDKPEPEEGQPKPFEKKNKNKFQNQERNDRDDGRPLPDRYNEYTPLTRPRSEILAFLSNKGYDIRWPRPMPNTKKTRTSNEYCEFHKGRGHTTKKCAFLKNEVEQYARNKLLDGFAVNVFDASRHERTEQARNERNNDRAPGATTSASSRRISR